MRIGDVVDDRFEVEAVAGAGGMGAVYRARDRASGDTVALKVMLAETSGLVARFEREAEVLAELSHPAIVRHRAHGTTREGGPYLAMEWLDGEDLAGRLERKGLTVDETVAMGHAVAAALGAAHAHGVVHRDVKPSNIFLVGKDVRAPKVLDFGIARRLGANATLTHAGGVVGTIGYMAPEQARGDTVIDARADVFALGCVLYECLAGRPAFEGSQPVAVLMKLVLEEPPRVRELNLAVPAALDELIARMLAKPAGQRPPDGAAVAQALAEVAARAPTRDVHIAAPASVRPPSLTRREQRLFCVVLARRALAAAPARADAHTLGADEVRHDPLEALRAQLAPLSARAERLADGSLIAVVAGVGHATDLAARAARCALALRQALPSAPIALATGRGDDDARVPAGEVVERVARTVHGAMPGGAVRVDEVTAGLLGDRFEVAGTPPALELLREREQARVTRTLLGRPAPCVGRDRELASVLAVFDECVTESVARAVLVSGEPGIGKSRLRYELLRRLEDRDERPQVWIGRGDEFGRGGAYALVRPSLREALGLTGGQPLAAAQRALQARVARNVPERLRCRVAAFLGEWVGVPFDAAEDAALATARRDAMVMGDQMRLAWQEFLRAETEDAPVLVVLEDLQWGDRPSIALLDLALRNLRDRPWMVLAVARPEVRQVFPALWDERGLIDVRLGPLTPRASERLVRAVLGELAPERVAVLVERAAGSPLYLEELVRAEADGHGDEVPQTVLALAQARLAALDGEARRVLRAASVFGMYFRAREVAALLGGARSTREVDEVLARLEATEWIARVGGDLLEGDAEYAFRQSVVREAAYSLLTEGDQRLGHKLAAEALALRDERDAVVVAEHFEKGGAPEQAVAWYLRAAEQALDGNDPDAVLTRTQRAVACGARGEALGAIRALEAVVFRHGAQWVECEARAAEAAALLPDGSDGAWDNLGELLLARLILGRRDAAEPLADAVARALSEKPREALLRTAARAAGNLRLCGAPERGDAILARLEAVVERGDGSAALSPAARGWLERARAVRALQTGAHEAFADWMLAAVAHFESAGDVRLACTRRVEAAYALLELGRHEAAARLLRAAIEEAPRLGLARAHASALHNLGWALFRAGQLDEALATERAALAMFVAQGDARMACASRVYCARIALAAGDLDLSEAEAEQARDEHDVAPTLRAVGPATLGAVRLAQGRPDEARAATTDAMALLAAHGADEGEGFIRVTHAQALWACGERSEARAAVAVARDRLLERARSTGGARETFLGDVAEHALTLRLAAEWGTE